ncbi:recombinase family protein [Novosphingobium resinovorum]
MIDDDLGRTASGAADRPGFERLVSGLCTGMVGAVLCLDASRLSRNGRDWHHLLELCGLVEARVIDLDGVYDPCRPNDRLLLGMKGSISEFELGILRTRMLDAARAKARRGNCASVFRSAISGTAIMVWGLILTFGCRRLSALSFRASASLVAPARC